MGDRLFQLPAGDVCLPVLPGKIIKNYGLPVQQDDFENLQIFQLMKQLFEGSKIFSTDVKFKSAKPTVISMNAQSFTSILNWFPDEQEAMLN